MRGCKIPQACFQEYVNNNFKLYQISVFFPILNARGSELQNITDHAQLETGSESPGGTGLGKGKNNVKDIHDLTEFGSSVNSFIDAS